MAACKRDTTDPLLRLFLDRYHLHLLAIPRENIDVGDAYLEHKGVVTTPGRLAAILTPELVLPEIGRGERLADIVGRSTDRVEESAGATVLEGILAGLGLPASVSAKTALHRAGQISFRFQDVDRDSLDVFELGRLLPEHTIDRRNALITGNERILVATAVLFTSSITLELEKSVGGAVEGKLNALSAARGDLSIKLDRSNWVRIQSKQRLGFAVELHELMCNDGEPLQLKKTSTLVRVRGSTLKRERVVPALIGNPDSDVLLTVD
jgi:hypothetical protein